MMSVESNKAFVSYSRKDSLFLDWLIEKLTAEKIELYYDVRDIAPAEDWQQRLSCLIREGEAFICIVSTNYQASKICRWELKEALINKKRIIPCVYDKEDLRIELDPEISKLNFVVFDDFIPDDRSIDQLLIALKLDVMWMREHTRLQNIAYRWDESGRPDYMLLKSPELTEVDNWVSRRSSFSSEITELQSNYFRKSRDINQKSAIELKGRIRSACKIVLSSQSMVESYAREIDILAVLENNHFIFEDNVTDSNLPSDALLAAALTLSEISALTINTDKNRSLTTAWRAFIIICETYNYCEEDYHNLNIYGACIDRLGESLIAHQKHSDALRIYRKCLYIAKIWLKCHSKSEYIQNCWTMISVFSEKISDIMRNFGNLRRAEKLLSYALDIREHREDTPYLNISHRAIAVLYEKVAMIALDEGKFEKCRVYMYKSQNIMWTLNSTYSEHLGIKRDYAITLETISSLYQDTGIYDKSYAFIDKSLSVMHNICVKNSHNFLWQSDLCRISSKYIIAGDKLPIRISPKYHLSHSRKIFDDISDFVKKEYHSNVNWKAYIGFTQTISSSYRADNNSIHALEITLQAIDILKTVYQLNDIDSSLVRSVSNTINNASWYCIIENMLEQAFYLSKMAIEKDPGNTALYANYFIACVMSDRNVIANRDWHASEILCARYGEDLQQMLSKDLEELSNEISVLQSNIHKVAAWLEKNQH